MELGRLSRFGQESHWVTEKVVHGIGQPRSKEEYAVKKWKEREISLDELSAA